MLRQLKSKDQSNFIYYCQNKDNDFYITKDNKRFYLTDIKIAKQVFNDCLKHNDKCFVKEEHDVIKAIMLIVGYKDKFPRKYIKVLSKNKKNFEDLFSYLQWQNLKDLFIKVKIYNKNFVKYDEKIKRYKPSYILRKNGFSIIAVREKDREVLLKKSDRHYFKKPFINKEDNKGQK